MNVAVTVRFAVKVRVQGFVLGGESHPVQLPNTDGLIGDAVSVTGVPLANCARHGVGLLQLKPSGELATFPNPVPAKVKVRTGAPVPPFEPVKQVTFPVMYPVTTAPLEDRPPSLLLVVIVAETSDAPQERPVAVRRPEASTVII